MKKFLMVLGFILFPSLTLAQGSGTPNTLRVLTDANGYLVVVGAAQTNPTTSSVFSNTRLKTDASGYLQVVLTGGTFTGPLFAPVEADCSVVAYSFTGRTTTGLNSHAANTWNLCGGGTLGLSGNTTDVISALQLTVPKLLFSTNLGSINPASNGVFTLLDTAGTSFGRLQLGGTTSSFPAIKRSSATIAFRLADDSADAAISSAAITTSGNINFSNSNGGTVTGGGAFQVYNSANTTGRFRIFDAAGAEVDTSGFSPLAHIGTTWAPGSGNANWANLELRPTFNGTSSGYASALGIATLTNTLTGGTLYLIDAGTTTTSYGSGFTRKFSVTTDGFTVLTGYHSGSRTTTCTGAGSYVTEALTLSGAISTTTNFIPAGATVVNVSTTVTTTITGASGYTVGDGTDADRWGDITGTAVGTNSGSANSTADPRWWTASARAIVLTAKTSNFTGGVAQITACLSTSAGS